jgi:hypothetical protein
VLLLYCKLPESPEIAKRKNRLTADERGLPRIKASCEYFSEHFPHPRKIRGNFHFQFRRSLAILAILAILAMA